MAQAMMAIGRMISIMASAKRAGRTALSMKASIRMEENMAMVGSFGLMAALLKGILCKTEWMEQGRTSGMTDDATQENGKTT